jgi:hypothetical protein
MSYDDFKDHPKSLNEVKADKQDQASLWTVRDALISVLRDIDNGAINPDTMVIALGTHTDNGANTNTNFVCVAKNNYEAQGVVMRALFLLNNGGRL